MIRELLSAHGGKHSYFIRQTDCLQALIKKYTTLWVIVKISAHLHMHSEDHFVIKPGISFETKSDNLAQTDAVAGPVRTGSTK